MKKLSMEFIKENLLKTIEKITLEPGEICDAFEIAEMWIFDNKKDAETELENFGKNEAVKMIVEFETSNFGEISSTLSDPIDVANTLFFANSINLLNDLMQKLLGKVYIGSNQDLAMLHSSLK